MNKKIFYAILVCVIIAGAVVIATIGLKTDITYSRNLRLDVYLGKEYTRADIEPVAKEVFGNERMLIQQVEYYGDMFSITISQEVEEVDSKIEQLTNKLNEKLGLELKKESITKEYQPHIRLFSVLKPYLLPLAISMIVILAYVMIRFRKIGAWRTLALYVLMVLASELIYLSILAICRIPINRLVTPIGLAIYVIVITILTARQEKKLAIYQEENK
jgi:preprotein translocase subunit SecF